MIHMRAFDAQSLTGPSRGGSRIAAAYQRPWQRAAPCRRMAALSCRRGCRLHRRVRLLQLA
eukprot:CAMPEP_0119376254 /NCGR_PEP_ID=MMETSP1334-20130426/39785_1 /TAXON_ID=127549 /ORGANISM="Calcidiscus leptoporus, Strain RCC1130" /LENGTH=60 /DNA_ID=CAMNT_0007394783 /DNA_START=317 /DNA_END=495 /DNA_ORIENTATION=+